MLKVSFLSSAMGLLILPRRSAELYRARIQVPEASLGSLISDGVAEPRFHPILLYGRPCPGLADDLFQPPG